MSYRVLNYSIALHAGLSPGERELTRAHNFLTSLVVKSIKERITIKSGTILRKMGEGVTSVPPSFADLYF